MTDADGLRAEIDVAIQAGEKVQRMALAYQEAIRELQGAVLLLDLRADNRYSRSISRWTPTIGAHMYMDTEVTGQVLTELATWRSIL